VFPLPSLRTPASSINVYARFIYSEIAGLLYLEFARNSDRIFQNHALPFFPCQ
jgi:hypothetical protein